MSSGVQVQPCCVEVFNQIKLGHKFRYIVYALTKDLKEITVLKTAPTTNTYDDLVMDLQEAQAVKECRYAVFDANFNLADGSRRSKLVFFLWSPDEATIKQKMLYTSSKDYIKRALVGIGKEIQANDMGDLAWSNILETLMRNEVAQ
jgi:cofilin